MILFYHQKRGFLDNLGVQDYNFGLNKWSDGDELANFFTTEGRRTWRNTEFFLRV